MIIDIYCIKDNIYLCVPAGVDISTINLPEGEKNTLILDLINPNIAIDNENIIQDIGKNGYAIYRIEVSFEINENRED